MSTLNKPIPGKRRLPVIRKPRRTTPPHEQPESDTLDTRIARHRAQALRGHESMVALYAQWKAEADKMTPEERAAEALAFEKLMASIAETRASTREQLID